MGAGDLSPVYSGSPINEQLVERMNAALRIPGVANTWSMPIKARIDLLTTEVSTPVGIKIFGAGLNEIQIKAAPAAAGYIAIKRPRHDARDDNYHNRY